MPFDPFQDRLSRDIRNDMSETIIEVLEHLDIRAAETVAKGYLEMELEEYYQDYIHDRLSRYRSALEVIRSGPGDVFWRALVLWDRKLFFEVHEILEHAWRLAGGAEKKILQAMIRSAGVYIKLEYGYVEGARKMAERALPVLTEHHAYLARYFTPEKLVSSLRDLRDEPPRLLV